MPHKWVHSIWYKKYHNGQSLDYKNPKTYDEKIHWHIVNTYGPAYGKYADKYQVRQYVEECGLRDLLIPLVGGPYKTVEEIDFDSLPDEFVIKTTHASGPQHYYICKDKTKVDKTALCRQMNAALRENYEKRDFEYHYSGTKPQLICEQLLHTNTERMTDYKVVCSYGRPIAILVCYNRNQGRDYYSPEWDYLEYTKEQFRSSTPIEKPGCLAEMLNAAGKLSKPFPLARIDFYIVNDKLFFGEITLTPSAGRHNNLNSFGELELGRQLPPGAEI